MTNAHGELTLAIAHSLAHLDQTLLAFQRALRDSHDQSAGFSLSHPPSCDRQSCLSAQTEEGNRVVEQLIHAYGMLDYPPTAKDGRESWDCPGVLAVPTLTLSLVYEVNQAKTAFKEAVEAANQLFVSEQGITVDNPGKARVTWHTSGLSYASGLLPEGVYPLARWHLAHLGRANLNLRQCWRHIQVMDEGGYAPDSVTFSWLHKRNVSRVVCEEVRARVRAIESDHPEVMRMKHAIEAVPKNEVMAYVQHPSPTLVATGMWKGDEREPVHGRKSHDRIRTQRVANIPILIPFEGRVVDEDLPMPVKSPKNTPDARSFQVRRKGRKLEDEPLLPSFNVYRYLPDHRILV